MIVAEANDQRKYASIEGVHADEPSASVLDQIQNLNIDDASSDDESSSNEEYGSDLDQILKLNRA